MIVQRRPIRTKRTAGDVGRERDEEKEGRVSSISQINASRKATLS